ncbi:MAG: hypothetical protein AAFQ94_06955 [Bacteroidota bacterium]
MKKNQIIAVGIALMLVLLQSNQVMAGGGWPQKKGSGFFKLGQYFLRSSQYFNPEGNLISVQPRISVYNTSFYGEYGITDRLTGIVYFPFFSRSTLNNLERRNGEFVPGDEVNSVGDTDISLKYGLIVDKPIVVSARLTLGLPLGNPSGGTTGTLQTGDGEFNQMLTIEASHSFYPVPLYATLSAGFNNRTNNFSDEVRFGAEAGYTIGKFTAVARVNMVESLMNGDGSTNSNQGVFGNNIEYLSFSSELIYSITENAGVSVSVATAFSGRQVLASPALDIGAFIKF